MILFTGQCLDSKPFVPLLVPLTLEREFFFILVSHQFLACVQANDVAVTEDIQFTFVDCTFLEIFLKSFLLL